MKKVRALWLLILMAISPLAWAGETQDKQEGWPRSWHDDSATFVMYEPQIESWNDYTDLQIRVAIHIEIEGDPEPWYAAVELSAKTVSDMESRKVEVYEIETKKLTWQSAQNPPKDVIDAYDRLAPLQPFEVALDNVLAHLDEAPQNSRRKTNVKLSFEPPKVFYAEGPAILVTTDGQPVVKNIDESPVMSVVNTEWDIFFDKDGPRYLLRDGACWYQTPDLEKGPWAPLGVLPEFFFELPDVEAFDPVFESTETECARTAVPEIFFATTDATILNFNGKPEYSPIKGTELLYATNTESDVFMFEGKTWLLLGGRWFTAGSPKGPWNAQPNGPPKAFAKIPEDHPKAGVLASVPGTREALEASMAAEIPQQAEVKRDTVVKVSYMGDPEWKQIEGVKVKYATNTSYDVFLVNGTYWACVNGIWFVSASANGPFVVADTVDPLLYTIPSSSPKHNVTYVYVYDSSPTVVVVGYTAPYYGVYAYHGVVLYGSGYHYHYPWRYHAHYHWGWHYHSHYRPHHYHGRRYAPVRYNPHMRGYQRRSYGRGHVNGRPYRSTSVRGGNGYSSWGKTTVQGRHRAVQAGHYTRNGRTVSGARSTTGAKAARVRGPRGSATVAKGRNGNVYAGRNGKVYRKNGSNYNRASSRARPTKQPNKTTRNNLNKVQGSRSRGQTKSRQYNDYRAKQPSTVNRSSGRKSRSNSRSKSRSNSRSRSRSPSRSRGGRRGGGRRR